MDEEASKFIKGLFSSASQTEVFVSDITYVESAKAYILSKQMLIPVRLKVYRIYRMICVRENVMGLLHMAMQHLTDRALGMIHHSDRGSQYCSELYQSALRHYGICPSMTDG